MKSRLTNNQYDIEKVAAQYPRGRHDMILHLAEIGREIAKKKGTCIGVAVDSIQAREKMIDDLV